MSVLRADLRFAWRMLRGQPVVTFAAVATLALGIGANTAVFSVLDAVLLQPLPWHEPERLVLVWGTDPEQGRDRESVSYTDSVDWRAQSASFEALATFASWRPILSGRGGDAERIGAARVADGFFDALGARAELGRLFSPDDQRDGNDQVAVLSHGLWQRRYGGDPDVVGTTVRLNLVPYTVIGVLPATFESLPRGLLAAPAEAYRPLAYRADEGQRAARHLRAIARLDRGATLEEARAELSLIASRLAERYPTSNAGYGVRIVPLADDLVGGVRSTLLLLLGAVGLVLLTACVNVGNLLLSQSIGRQQEIALRAALGAGRFRIVRQLLTESLLLAAAGGLAGLLLAGWSVDLIASYGPRLHPALDAIGIDGSVLAFTACVSLVAALVFGLVPAIRASHTDLESALRRSTGRVASGPQLLRDGLVVGQLALALMLLIGAALVVQSVWHLNDVDPGFDPSDKLAMDIWLPWKKYREPAKQVAFFREAVERIATLPGVRDAGVVSVLPFGGNHDRVGVAIEGRDYPPGREPNPDRFVVSSGYLEAMPIRLVRGRQLDARDAGGSQPTVLISETMARELWPDADPLGRRVRLPDSPDDPQPWRTIVGVVADVRQYGLDRPGSMQLYLPIEQYPWSYMTLVVRTSGAGRPAGVAAAVRAELKVIDPDLPVFNVASLDELLSHSIALRRFTMWLLAAFAATALLLAAVGVYGVFTHAVSQRVREFGVRMALGARPRDVLRLVLGRGARVTAAGLVAGFAGAWALTRLLHGLLFDVGPTHPPTFALTGLVLGAVALAACWLPAHRATTVDTLAALRDE